MGKFNNLNEDFDSDLYKTFKPVMIKSYQRELNKLTARGFENIKPSKFWRMGTYIKLKVTCKDTGKKLNTEFDMNMIKISVSTAPGFQYDKIIKKHKNELFQEFNKLKPSDESLKKKSTSIEINAIDKEINDLQDKIRKTRDKNVRKELIKKIKELKIKRKNVKVKSRNESLEEIKALEENLDNQFELIQEGVMVDGNAEENFLQKSSKFKTNAKKKGIQINMQSATLVARRKSGNAAALEVVCKIKGKDKVKSIPIECTADYFKDIQKWCLQNTNKFVSIFKKAPIIDKNKDKQKDDKVLEELDQFLGNDF